LAFAIVAILIPSPPLALLQMANLPSKIDLILLDEPYALPKTLTTRTELLDIKWFKQTIALSNEV